MALLRNACQRTQNGIPGSLDPRDLFGIDALPREITGAELARVRKSPLHYKSPVQMKSGGLFARMPLLPNVCERAQT